MARFIDKRSPDSSAAGDLSPGILSEFWGSGTPLPQLKGAELYLSHFQRGVQTAIALPMSNAITILSVAVSLFLFSIFLIVLTNVDRFLTDAGGMRQVTVYFKKDATDEQTKHFLNELENQRGSIQSHRFVSKKEALDIFRRDLGKRSGFLIGLDERNPLPASVDIVLQPDELGLGAVDKILDNFSHDPIVEEVVYGSKWVERSQGVLRLFRLFGFIFVVFVLGIIVFLVSNTIRIVIYARRDEIEIMQLVGAGDWFIKLPFFIGGALQGLVGAVLALVSAMVIYKLLDMQLHQSSLFGVALPQLMFLGASAIIGIILLGVIVGGVGSLFSLRRFMGR